MWASPNVKYRPWNCSTRPPEKLASVARFPSFLFFRGDSNFRHNVPGVGEIFPVLIPFILLGLGVSAFKKEKRDLFALLPVYCWHDIGFADQWRHSSCAEDYFRCCLPRLATVPVLVLVSAQIAFLLYTFFKYPAISEYWFQYGLKEAIEYAETHAENYDNVIFSRDINQGYIFPLFFTRRDPGEFQKTGRIGKYFVCRTDIEDCYGIKGRNLFLVSPYKLRDKSVKKIIYYSSGEAAYKIVE